VDLAVPRTEPPLVIPGDTLVVRGDGPQVAVVDRRRRGALPAASIWAAISATAWRCWTGSSAGQMLAVNPGDTVREGVRVKPQAAAEKAAPKR
jgi:hypothetical protein